MKREKKHVPDTSPWHALYQQVSVRQDVRIVDYSIVELGALFRSGQLTSVQVTEAYFERIDRLNGPFETYAENGGYNAFVRIDRVEALQQAREADIWIADPSDPRGEAPPLCGIPMGVKDSIGVKGRESKNGYEGFATNIALKDATAVARLREQGAVILGHTMCSQLSMSIVGNYGCNAWDRERVPGGSSSGSGIAPVARLCAGALGEETGGSITIPASANGASAVKPSLGLVSTAGVMPYGIGLDVVGSMARSMQDAALIFSSLVGPDPAGDPLTLDAPIPIMSIPILPLPGNQPLEGFRIAVAQTFWLVGGPATPPEDFYETDHKEAFERFKSELEQLGATVVNIEGPDMEKAENQIYYGGPYLIEIDGQQFNSMAVARECLHYEAGLAEGMNVFAESRPEPWRSALQSLYNLEQKNRVPLNAPYSIRYAAEINRRRQIDIWQDALNDDQIDFLVMLPLGKYPGFKAAFSDDADEMFLRKYIKYYDLPNVLGWPVVTFPIGHGSTNVPSSRPINAAFWGPRFSDATLIQAAIDYQQHHPEHHGKAPADPAFPPLKTVPVSDRQILEVLPDESTDPVYRYQKRRDHDGQ